MKLPFALRQELIKENLVLFIGAGFVKNYLPSMPSWGQLLTNCFETLSGHSREIMKYGNPILGANGKPTINPSQFLRLAQMFEIERPRINTLRRTKQQPEISNIYDLVVSAILKAYSREKARKVTKDSFFMKAKSLPINLWLTTNYDTFLEDTFFDRAADLIMARPITNVYFRSPAERRILLKIHGSVETPKSADSIVITEEDYFRFLRKDKYLISKLYTLFCERTVVFLGYSLNDPNIQMVYHDVLLDQSPEARSSLRPSYFITRDSIRPDERQYYSYKNIQCIEDCEIEEFFAELLKHYAIVESDRKGIGVKIQANINTYKIAFNRLSKLREFRDKNGGQYPAPPKDASDLVDQWLDFHALFLKGPEIFSKILTASFPGVGWNDFVGAIHESRGVIAWWGDKLLEKNDGSVLEQVMDYVQNYSVSLGDFFIRFYLELIINWLVKYPATPHRIDFIRRCSDILFEYDEKNRSWEDYARSLESLISVSSFVPEMSAAHQLQWGERLHWHLAMCGRSVGDSWYSTDKVYESWGRFNPTAWPFLQKQIEDHQIGAKEEAILNYLKPGADFHQFLPRA